MAEKRGLVVKTRHGLVIIPEERLYVEVNGRKKLSVARALLEIMNALY